jgi:hypothetical protein
MGLIIRTGGYCVPYDTESKPRIINPLNKDKKLSEKFINNIKRTTFWAMLFSLVTHAVLYGISFIDMVTNEGLGLDWVAVKHSGWNIVLSPFFAAINDQVVYPLILFAVITTGLVFIYAGLTGKGYFTYLRGQKWDAVVKGIWFTSAALMGIIYGATILQTAIPHLRYSGFTLTTGVMSIPAIMMLVIIDTNFIDVYMRHRKKVKQGIHGTPEDNQ